MTVWTDQSVPHQLRIFNCAGGCDEHRPHHRAPSPGLCEVSLMGDVVEFCFNL
jgi:hypothetical protein